MSALSVYSCPLSLSLFPSLSIAHPHTTVLINQIFDFPFNLLCLCKLRATQLVCWGEACNLYGKLTNKHPVYPVYPNPYPTLIYNQIISGLGHSHCQCDSLDPVTSYELPVASFKLPVVSCHLPVASCLLPLSTYLANILTTRFVAWPIVIGAD